MKCQMDGLAMVAASTADSQVGATVHEAFRSLSAEHRAAIIRVHYCNESVSEFARRENIPESAVRIRLHDALHALRRAVAGCGAVG
jgi:DNA-directed RNA polymerase specialized sigma24 family protein